MQNNRRKILFIMEKSLCESESVHGAHLARSLVNTNIGWDWSICYSSLTGIILTAFNRHLQRSPFFRSPFRSLRAYGITDGAINYFSIDRCLLGNSSSLFVVFAIFTSIHSLHLIIHKYTNWPNINGFPLSFFPVSQIMALFFIFHYVQELTLILFKTMLHR